MNGFVNETPRIDRDGVGGRCVARRRIAFVLKRTRGAPRWGRDQALLSSLGESEDRGCVWAVSSAPGWRLSDVCERDQRELAGVVCFGDHVGHCEVGAEPVTDAARDLGVAVGQVGVEAR